PNRNSSEAATPRAAAALTGEEDTDEPYSVQLLATARRGLRFGIRCLPPSLADQEHVRSLARPGQRRGILTVQLLATARRGLRLGIRCHPPSLADQQHIRS